MKDKSRECKICFWDIESSPNLVTSWQINKQFISYDNIIREREIICLGYKFLGDKKVTSISLREYTEEEMLQQMHDLLSKADIVVHHNGDRFDLPMFNARAIKYGLDPLPPKQTVDTLKVARKHFRFNSNKLDYLGQYLGVGGKMPTRKGLWKEILAGVMYSELHNEDLSAETKGLLKEMEQYNAQDVALLEDVYTVLRGYITNHPNAGLHSKHDVVCPNCGSQNVHKKGSRVTRTGKYDRFQCQDCGAWSSVGTSDKTVELR